MSLCSKQFQILNSPELDSGLDVFSPEKESWKFRTLVFTHDTDWDKRELKLTAFRIQDLGKKSWIEIRSSRKLIELFFEEYPSILPVFQ